MLNWKRYTSLSCFRIYNIPGVRLYINSWSTLVLVSYHSHCMHGSRPWIREPAPSDPAHVRYVNTYRELEHFLIHFLICSYFLNYHVNPTQVLGCLAVRIARIWITSQMIRHWLGHVMWYLWEPRIWGSQLSVTGTVSTLRPHLIKLVDLCPR